MNKLKTLIIYSSRKTGNSKKLAEGIQKSIPDSDVFSVENALSLDLNQYDFIIFGTGIYRGWPDEIMRNYMKQCKNKNVGFFITLGSWPDSEHAHICKGRIEGLLSDCNIIASFICHGRIDPELVERMKNKPNGAAHSWNEERAKRISAAESHPDENDIRNASGTFTSAIEKIKKQKQERQDDPIPQIKWNLNGAEIERESFKIIESEFPHYRLDENEWKIIRRIIHTTADFSIAQHIKFRSHPIEKAISALKKLSAIYCDSNMIKAGISISKLKKINQDYSEDMIKCYIADDDVAKIAKEKSITRALAAVEKALPLLDGAIVLIGNAPLALAKIAKLTIEGKIKPELVIAMPVGFVNVVESKELLKQSNLPYILVDGRRGGSTLAVAALHAITECA